MPDFDLPAPPPAVAAGEARRQADGGLVRWLLDQRLNGAGLLPLVRAGVRFVDGRPEARGETETEAQKEAA